MRRTPGWGLHVIVCHCNAIAHTAIEDMTDRLFEADPARSPSPVRVYDALGMRPKCGRCLPHAARLINGRCASASAACGDCPLTHLTPRNEVDSAPMHQSAMG